MKMNQPNDGLRGDFRAAYQIITRDKEERRDTTKPGTFLAAPAPAQGTCSDYKFSVHTSGLRLQGKLRGSAGPAPASVPYRCIKEQRNTARGADRYSTGETFPWYEMFSF